MFCKIHRSRSECVQVGISFGNVLGQPGLDRPLRARARPLQNVRCPELQISGTGKGDRNE